MLEILRHKKVVEKKMRKDMSKKLKYLEKMRIIQDKAKGVISKIDQKELKKPPHVVCAYFQFQSMNGQSKFSKAFDTGACTRCCRVGKYKHKYLRDNWPKIKSAPEPSNVLWKNLAVDGFTRSCRSLVVWIFGILLVIVTLAAVFFATKYRQTHEETFTFIDCFNFDVSAD